VQVARETGYLDGVQNFRGADLYGHFPSDKVLALCTGSQGEPRAALARIANDDHPEVTLNKGDRVIFAAGKLQTRLGIYSPVKTNTK